MSMESVLNSALRETANLFKIETYSDDCSEKIREFIVERNHKCAVLGWAVITDFPFADEDCLPLLQFISTITEDVSEEDKQFFVHC